MIDYTTDSRCFPVETTYKANVLKSHNGPLVDKFKGDSGMDLTISSSSQDHNLKKGIKRCCGSSSDKSLTRGFILIKDFAAILALTAKVIDDSNTIFETIVKQKKLKGRNMNSVVAAIIYVASKNCGNPRNLNGNIKDSLLDIIKKTVTAKKEVTKSVFFVRKFSGKPNQEPEKIMVVFALLIISGTSVQ